MISTATAMRLSYSKALIDPVKINSKPFIEELFLNTTSYLNTTMDNVTAWSVFNDRDGDAVSIVYNFFNNNKSITLLNFPMDYDPKTRTTHDYSHNQEAYIINADYTSKGIIGGAFQFNGAGDYLRSVMLEPANKIQNSFAYSAWAYPIGYHPGYQHIITQYLTGPDYAAIYITGDTGMASCVLNNKPSGYPPMLIESTKALPTYTWHYIVCDYDLVSNKFSMYINGELDNSITITQLPPFNLGGTLDIGGLHHGNYDFRGKIDEVMLYNVSLTEQQISLDYKSRIPNYSIMNSSHTYDWDNWTVQATPIDEHGLSGSTKQSNIVMIRKYPDVWVP